MPGLLGWLHPLRWTLHPCLGVIHPRPALTLQATCQFGACPPVEKLQRGASAFTALRVEGGSGSSWADHEDPCLEAELDLFTSQPPAADAGNEPLISLGLLWERRSLSSTFAASSVQCICNLRCIVGKRLDTPLVLGGDLHLYWRANAPTQRRHLAPDPMYLKLI